MVMTLSLIENIIGNLFVSRENKAILRQINTYEVKRAEISKSEHLAQLLADWAATESLPKTEATLRKEESRARKERERYEALINDLVKRLESDKP